MRSAYVPIGLFILLFTSAAAAVDIRLTSKTPAQAWIPPVTPYGTPDLEGVWVNNRATPLERPKALRPCANEVTWSPEICLTPCAVSPGVYRG